MKVLLPFGEWLPDLPVFNNPGALTATNVIPDAVSYRPFPSKVVYTTAIGGVCKGAIPARKLDGSYVNYAGDSSALYTSIVLSWSNSTRLVGGAYTTAQEDFWEFTQFGTQLVAVNGFTDAPQVMSVGAANFVVLPGSPPKAKHVATVRDFVVMGNLSSSVTSPQMVRWCAINNSASWTPDAATMADFQDLPGDGGWVQKIVGGEYGTVFQERAIYRMTFVGSPLIFQFDKVQTNIGAYAPNSVVSHRNTSFFLSDDGFYVFDGSTVQPIGQNKVDRTFLADLDTAFKYRISAAIDPVRKIVAWAYPGAGNSGGNPNKIMLYNWATKRWARIEGLNIEILVQLLTVAQSMESLDALFSNLDMMTISLDSSVWNGGTYIFSCFDSDHKHNIFNGSAMPATVETNEVQFNQKADGKTYITQVRNVIDGVSTSATTALGVRNVLTEAVSYTAATSPNSTGFVSVRSTGRFHRVKVSTFNDFIQLQGVEVVISEDGVR